MASQIAQGFPITLDAFFYDNEGNPVNPVDPQASIVDANGTTVVSLDTPTNVSVGHYQYVYAVAADALLGAWAIRWFGSIDGFPLTDEDGFTVVTPGSISVGGSGEGQTCQPWATHEDAIGPCADYTVDPDEVDVAMQIATDILWNLTGRRYSGICSDSIRPNAQWRAFDHGPRWWPSTSSGAPWGWCSCHRGRDTGCASVPEIRLPNAPVVPDSIVVKIDGDIFTDWRLDDGRYLVRTDGEGWPCFPAGTLVLTDAGLKPIEAIEAGERVLTHRNRWRTVTRAGKTGDSETVRMAGRGGTLRCTPDHRLWAAEVHGKPGQRKLGAPEWQRADGMLGHAWATPREIPELPIPMPEGWLFPPDRFWWFLGRWVGDGWTDAGSGRVVVCAGHHEAEELAEALSGMGWAWRRGEDRTSVKFRFREPALHAWLRDQFGTRAHNKRLPAWLLGAPEETRHAFLDGYVSADGWKATPARGRPFTSLRTVSRALAFGTRLLVASLGYAPLMYEAEQKTTSIEGRRVNVRRTYRVDWPEGKPGERKSQAWADDEHLWGRVRSVELDEEIVPVYDLEIEDDHSFIADGFVVHNCCQDMLLADTEENTFSIFWSWGARPPIGGVRAAALYGCQLLLAMNPGSEGCVLPDNVVQVVRQGVTTRFADPMALVQGGMTGLPFADAWVNSILLGDKRRRATAMIPGLTRVGRRTG